MLMKTHMSGSVSRSGQAAPLIYLQRDAFSFGSSLLMFGLLAVVATKPVIEQVVRLKDQEVVVELAEPIKEVEPEPVATPIPPPVVASAKPAVQTPRTIPQVATPSPTPNVSSTPTPAKTTAPAEEPVTKPVAPAIAAAEPVQQVKPTQPVMPAPAPAEVAPTVTPAPTPTPPPVSTKGQSDRYEAQVLRYLESVKRYPTSREARETRPSGVVTVWFELSRSGKVIDAGIEKSSNSSLLDAEAIKTVRNGNFPAFPEAVFANADKHRFSANLSYELKTSD
jgi:periplasmic protein TonB